MTKKDNHYYIPSAIDESVADVIIKQLSDVELTPGLVREIDDGAILSDTRMAKICWLPTDHWISGMMAHFVRQANLHHFHYDLYDWNDKIQYTVYNEGDHYRWHVDSAKSSIHQNFDVYRKLSISLCLTTDYEGGEFQLHHEPPRSIGRYKMKCGDVIIFSSDTPHRVRPVRSGQRISLVGWFGGPAWK